MHTAQLRLKLDRMLVLLRDYNEPHWYEYFSESGRLLSAGEINRAQKHIRCAYGGMGSFSDALYFTGAPAEVAREGYALRDELYALSEPRGFFASLFSSKS